MNPPRSLSKRRLNALCNAKLTAALLDAPQTAHDLAEASGLALFTARHYVLALHREGACYIAEWWPDSRGRYCTPAYMIGRKKDAVKPRQDNATRQREYRQRRAQVRALFALAA